MKTIKAREVTDLPPGTRIRIEGTEYIRLMDAEHNTDMVCCPESGWWGSCYRLALDDDDVEVL